MKVGTFTLIKNEARWIRAHLLSWLPFVDEQVFFDGNSTDGTIEVIKDVAANHPFGHRIKLYEGKDCSDMDRDYQRAFNECLKASTTDYAIFAHPDMILDDAGNIGGLGEDFAYTSSMRSFAGEPGGQMYEIKGGRAERWKNIYRHKHPDLGLHYFGAYGASNEDCYFSKITGSKHDFHGDQFERYPYRVSDSGIKISHFSDVRTLDRRIERMWRCLINQGYSTETAKALSAVHPRVNFSEGFGFKFEPVETPEYLKEGVTA